MPAALFLSAVLGIGLCGCQSGPEQYAAQPPEGGSRSDIAAERDDLSAALSYIQGRFEIALVESKNFPSGDFEYHLVSVTDEPVWIVLHLPPSEDPAIVEGAVTVRYGRFGDPDREQAIIQALRDRLRWLESRD